MDQLDYRELVQTILKNHVGNSLNSNTEVQLIFDTERDQLRCCRRQSLSIIAYRLGRFESSIWLYYLRGN